MRVVVTGGGGFIGAPTVRALRAAGHDACSFDVRHDPGLDVTDRRAVAAALAGTDVVVHLAAKVGLGVSLDDLPGYAATNDLGTAVVLCEAATAGVGRVVFASSMVVYGEGRGVCRRHGQRPVPPRRAQDLAAGLFEPTCGSCGGALLPSAVPETAPLDPRNVYAATKVHGEQLGAVWARETDGVFVALRFHNVYGAGMPTRTPYAGVAALFADRVANGLAPLVHEDGRQRRDFVHVDDVASAVRLATEADLTRGRPHAFNIGSGVVTTIGEVARRMAAAAGAPAPEITGRYRLGDVRHVTADVTAARSVLGWRATRGLAAGLAELFADRLSRV